MKNLLLSLSVVLLASCPSMEPRPLAASEELGAAELVGKFCDRGVAPLLELLAEHPEYIAPVLALNGFLPAASTTE